MTIARYLGFEVRVTTSRVSGGVGGLSTIAQEAFVCARPPRQFGQLLDDRVLPSRVRRRRHRRVMQARCAVRDATRTVRARRLRSSNRVRDRSRSISINRRDRQRSRPARSAHVLLSQQIPQTIPRVLDSWLDLAMEPAGPVATAGRWRRPSRSVGDVEPASFVSWGANSSRHLGCRCRLSDRSADARMAPRRRSSTAWRL